MPEEPTAADKKWEAESDANTLATANVILNDNKRLKAAQKAAKGLAKDAKERFDGMMRVAGKGKTVEGMRVLENNKE